MNLHSLITDSNLCVKLGQIRYDMNPNIVKIVNAVSGCRNNTSSLPPVLHTGHQQSEHVEGEENTQTEQHAHHIYLRCGEQRQMCLSL